MQGYSSKNCEEWTKLNSFFTIASERGVTNLQQLK